MVKYKRHKTVSLCQHYCSQKWQRSCRIMNKTLTVSQQYDTWQCLWSRLVSSWQTSDDVRVTCDTPRNDTVKYHSQLEVYLCSERIFLNTWGDCKYTATWLVLKLWQTIIKSSASLITALLPLTSINGQIFTVSRGCLSLMHSFSVNP